MAEFSELKGKTLIGIKIERDYDDKITFMCDDGVEYVMQHYQDCCENVFIEDITGNLNSLTGSPILLAEEVRSTSFRQPEEDEYFDDAYQWTFYKLATILDSVTIRWFGQSNGYYSVDVGFYKTGED